MKHIILFALVMIPLTGCHQEGSISMRGRWTENQVNGWYDTLPWIKGFNYVPSYAGNTTEWWENELDTLVIDREMRWAKELGYTSTRAFIQYIVWKKDPVALKNKVDLFLKITSRHGISVMPVLFDDCAFGDPVQLDPFLGKQREIIPGMILSNWTPSPGKTLGTDPEEETLLREYVQDMLETFGEDNRVIFWDLFNEPTHAAGAGTPDLLVKIYSWAREVNPSQPLSVSVWYTPNDHPVNIICLGYSDLISFHLYSNRDDMSARIEDLRKYNRPIICTEWMARARGSNFATELPLFKSERVAAYQWGLVNGRTQCQYPWWNKPGGEVDSVVGWFHDILHTDGTSYRQEEIDIIRQY
jgi:hypothetical protein